MISTSSTRLRRSLPLAIVFVVIAAVQAHHGSGDYHVDREVTVAGIVKEWKWTQPHTWVHIDVKRPGGIEAWNGEGPPLQWAAARGWSVATLKPGEAVRLLVVAGRYFVVCFSSSKIVTNAPPGPPRPGARL